MSFHTIDFYPSNVPLFASGIQPTGTINGSNVTFTLPSAPSPVLSLMLYLNGALQNATTAPVDYTLSGSTVTFAYAPPSGSTLLAWYMH